MYDVINISRKHHEVKFTRYCLNPLCFFPGSPENTGASRAWTTFWMFFIAVDVSWNPKQPPSWLAISTGGKSTTKIVSVCCNLVKFYEILTQDLSLPSQSLCLRWILFVINHQLLRSHMPAHHCTTISWCNFLTLFFVPLSTVWF